MSDAEPTRGVASAAQHGAKRWWRRASKAIARRLGRPQVDLDALEQRIIALGNEALPPPARVTFGGRIRADDRIDQAWLTQHEASMARHPLPPAGSGPGGILTPQWPYGRSITKRR